MTGINNSEGGEENVNTTSNENENKHSKLIKSYVSGKLDIKSDRLVFAKRIKSANTLPEDILAEINTFKDTKTEFSGLEVNNETVSLASIERELGSFLAENYSHKMTIRSSFMQEYDISLQDYTKYIAGAVDDIYSEGELRGLIDSDQQREEFIAQVYKKNTPKRRLVSHILSDMKIEDRFDKLEPHLKQAFMDTVSKLQRRESLQVPDFMSLFESNVLTTEEKQTIIETFMPSISIADALKLGIINLKQAKEIKTQALEGSFDSGFFNGINVDSYVANISNNELIFSTHGLFKNSKNQKKLFEQNFFFDMFKEKFDILLQKIEKDLQGKSIQTVEEMKEILSGIDHISGIENFKEGATVIIKQNQKDESGNSVEVELYAEILSLASAGTFILQERGVGEYTRNLKKSDRLNYSDFVNYITKGDIPNKVEFISSETLDHRIRTGEIQDENGNGRFEDRSEISSEISSLTKQIEDRKAKLRKEKIPKSKWNEDEKLQSLYKVRDEKNNLRKGVEGNNLQVLLQEIDDLDADGKKFKLEAGTSFVTNGGNGDVFSIQGINEETQTVVVRGLENDETISYRQFLQQFEAQKATRVSHINTFDDLFKQSDDAYKTWGEFELKSGKVRNKKSNKVDYEYLVPSSDSKNQELLKIHDIDNSMVTISFGEAKSDNTTDKKGDKKKGEIFATEKKEYRVSIGVLDHYIRKNGLSFRSLEEGKVAEEEMKGIPKPEEKFGFGTWFFKGMSIASVVKGSKTAIEQITNMLNEGDDNKANEFALKMFGPLLGQNGKTEMMSRVEQTQKKSMEEFIQRLKDINSKPATRMIESWLKDPRTPQYKVEAAVFYMFEKYGALCAKEMYKYQGQYFWYQKLGGRIGDSNWIKTHERNEGPPKQNTTEEQLVYNLFSEQVKDGGYGGVKRRSKLAKELKKMRGTGKEEEYNTGVMDGGNERSVGDRLTGAMSELSSGNYPNAWGWQETIENKGGSMMEMNMVPFVTMFSGMAYKFEKDMVDKIKNGAGDSRLIMMKSFISYPGDISLVNDTIMEACKNLDHDPKYKGILAKAQKVFDNQNNSSETEKEQQDRTIDFYKDYGEVLTNILYMLNTGDKDDVHNKMIFFEKDDNATFKRYYDKMEGLSGSADTDFGKNEGLMADAFAEAGTSGINIYKATKELLELRTGGSWSKHHSGPHMWKEIVKEFESIPKRKYSDSPIENDKKQRKLLEHNVRYFLAAITSLNTDTRFLSSYNAPTGPFNRLNDWGIYFDQVINAGANADSLKSGGHSQLIDKFVNGIMDYSINNNSSKIPTRSLGEGKYEYIEDSKEKETTGVTNLIKGEAMGTLNQVNKLKQSITPEGLGGFGNDESSEDVGRILEDA